MKAEKFSESLNNINDSFIEEAASYQAPKEEIVQPKAFRSLKVWRIVAIAACACLAVGVGILAIGASSMRMGSSGPAKGTANYSEGPDYYADNEDYVSNEGFDVDGLDAMETPESSGDGYAAGGEEMGTAGISKGLTQNSDAFLGNKNAKIIYTASLDITTQDFDETRAKIDSATTLHGGYFENMELSGYSSSYRSAYYQIRIPSKELDSFLNDAEKFGSVISLNKSGEDISEQYYDTESRLKTAKTKLKRLQELLAEAKDMSDIITLEEAISEVEWEIDDYSGSLKYYDSHVDYASVTIHLDEEYRTSEGDSFGDRLSSAFTGGLRGFKTAMQNLVIWFAESWIWVLIVAIVIAAVIIIVVKTGRRNRPSKKKE